MPERILRMTWGFLSLGERFNKLCQVNKEWLGNRSDLSFDMMNSGGGGERFIRFHVTFLNLKFVLI